MDCNGRCSSCGRFLSSGGDCLVCNAVTTYCWCGQRIYPPSFAHNCPKAYTYVRGETKDTQTAKVP